MKTYSNKSGGAKTYTAALKKLGEILTGERYFTAKGIARKTRCSRIQAYRRLEALRAAGVPISEKKVREGRTGPLARAFKIDRP
jgi:hypothetical protein